MADKEFVPTDDGNAGATDFDFGTPIAADFLTFGAGDNIGSDAGSGGDDSGDIDRNGNRFDPAIHSGRDKFNADGSYRRKRGRKSGSSAPNSGSRTKASNKAGIESFTRALLLVHTGLAGITKTPEIAIEESEAEMLASATHNVLVEFDIRPDPKAEAIFGLVTAATMVYGPRIYLIKQRKQAEKKND